MMEFTAEQLFLNVTSLTLFQTFIFFFTFVFIQDVRTRKDDWFHSVLDYFGLEDP